MALHIVIDANAAIRTVIGGPLSPEIGNQWENWLQSGAEIYAPHLWVNEVTSALHKIYKLDLVSESNAKAALDAALGLEVLLFDEDVELCRRAFDWATRLNQTAAYDGFYLALADRLSTDNQAELWTADERLANRARQAGVRWVHWFGE